MNARFKKKSSWAHKIREETEKERLCGICRQILLVVNVTHEVSIQTAFRASQRRKDANDASKTLNIKLDYSTEKLCKTIFSFTGTTHIFNLCSKSNDLKEGL